MTDYTVSNPNANASVLLSTRQGEDGISYIVADISFTEPTVPEPIKISWDIPCTDAWSVYSPADYYRRNIGPSWRKRTSDSSLAHNAPVQQLSSIDGRNRQTVALSDAAAPCRIFSGLVERTAMLNCGVILFTEPVDPLTSYTITVYTDTSDIRADEALKRVEKFWSDECGYPSAYIPEAARDSVYSTWYSYHKEIHPKEILRQCRMAVRLGMKTVIVDDGWQCDGDASGYARVGDWKPARSKVRDMKAFADAVHKAGMKFVLWYNYSMIGKEAEAYKIFKDKALNPTSDGNTVTLDPRYPEVRRYLVGILEKAVLNWGLDGFKLDFIDSYKRYPDTPAFSEGWDTISLDEGTDRLLSETVQVLRRINPEILIEFRQSYYGPLIRKYGNMIRVGDCPDDSMRNHLCSIDLRLLLGKTPVHSDMLMWHPDDTLEAAATQVISTLFAVPQISVRLDEIPPEHLAMLKFYLAFREAHRKTLLDGVLSADDPWQYYSQIRSELDGELIAAAFSRNVLDAGGAKTVYFINSGTEDRLYVRGISGKKTYRIISPAGKLIKRGSVTGSAVREFAVPRGGMLEIK